MSPAINLRRRGCHQFTPPGERAMGLRAPRASLYTETMKAPVSGISRSDKGRVEWTPRARHIMDQTESLKTLAEMSPAGERPAVRQDVGKSTGVKPGTRTREAVSASRKISAAGPPPGRGGPSAWAGGTRPVSNAG